MATHPLLRELPAGPSASGAGGSSFALDGDARRGELAATGQFVRIESELIPWEARMSTDEVRALYATFSSISRLPPDEGQRVLDGVARVAEREFGGDVRRPFVTAVYTAERRA